MSEILIHGARVVDPSQNLDAIQPIAIRDGRLVDPDSLEHPITLNLPGKTITPGLIDLHVHLREPGQTHKEDIASATAAAAAGGFTTVLAMPNTLPPPDNAEHVRLIRNLVDDHAAVNVLLSGCLSQNRAGNAPTNATELRDAGCVALSDDGSTPQDESVMRDIMTQAAKLNLPVIDHCENLALSKPGVMHQGRIAQLLHLPGQPREAELSIVRRDLRLAAETGCHIHLQHLSCRESVELLAQAQAHGVHATAEVTPHHLLLTDADCLRYGTLAKMAPPLREEQDRQALIAALRDGIISVLATDHAPHTAQEKAQGWLKAPFGIIGIQQVVPLCLDQLVHTGLLTLPQLIARLTTGPASLLASTTPQLGTLRLGAPAALTILDLNATHTLTPEASLSRSTNAPWFGRTCRGAVIGIIQP